MATLYNRARVVTATTGTGTMTLGAAVSAAYFTFAEAGVPNSTVVSYVVEDGTNVEMGVGTYTSAGTTLSRTTVTASKIGGTAGTSKIDLSGSAVVFIDALAADITVPPASATDTALALFDGTTGRLIKNSDATLGTTGLNISRSQPGSALNIFATNTSTAASSQSQIGAQSGTAAAFVVMADHNSAQSYLNAYIGNLQIIAASGLSFATNGSQRLWLLSTGEVAIGAHVPDRWLHAEQDSAATNAVTYVQRITSTSSGTPANGIGAGIEFEVETAAGNNEIGATIEAVTTDVTAASEDFDVVIKAMTAGAAAAEVARFKNANMHTILASGALPAANFVDITNIPARYSYLILQVAGASCATTTRQLWVRASTNNGSSFDATSGNYPGQKMTGATLSAITAASATMLESATMTNAQTQSFTLIIHGYQGGPHPRYDFRTITNTTEYQGLGTFIGAAGSPINALRIIWDSTGNFDAGTYVLYGVQ